MDKLPPLAPTPRTADERRVRVCLCEACRRDGPHAPSCSVHAAAACDCGRAFSAFERRLSAACRIEAELRGRHLTAAEVETIAKDVLADSNYGDVISAARALTNHRAAQRGS